MMTHHCFSLIVYTLPYLLQDYSPIVCTNFNYGPARYGFEKYPNGLLFVTQLVGGVHSGKGSSHRFPVARRNEEKFFWGVGQSSWGRRGRRGLSTKLMFFISSFCDVDGPLAFVQLLFTMRGHHNLEVTFKRLVRVACVFAKGHHPFSGLLFCLLFTKERCTRPCKKVKQD